MAHEVSSSLLNTDHQQVFLGSQPSIPQTRSRVIYFDAIKVFAIFLVCTYHYNDLNLDVLDGSGWAAYVNYFFYGAASMAVPLFFMVNGALLLNRTCLMARHLVKTLRLLALLWLWSALSLAGFALILGHVYSLKEFVLSWFYLRLDVSNHLWFLQALISIYLLFPFVKVVYDHHRRSLIGSFLVLALVVSFGNRFLVDLVNLLVATVGHQGPVLSSIDFFQRVNPFGGFSYTLVYFVVGGLLARRAASNTPAIAFPALVFGLLASLLLLFLYGLWMTHQAKAFYDTVWNGYTTLMTLGMSITTFLLFSRFGDHWAGLGRWVELIGGATLGIYFLHRFAGALTIKYFAALDFSESLLGNLLYGFLVVLLCLAVVLLLRRIPLLRHTVVG